MTIEISDEARKRLAAFLPEAMTQALESYQHFMIQPQQMPEPEHEEPEPKPDNNRSKPKPKRPKSKAKDFKEHHDAAKMAIAHMELLLKLAETLQAKNKGEAENENLKTLLDTARAEIQAKTRGNDE